MLNNSLATVCLLEDWLDCWHISNHLSSSVVVLQFEQFHCPISQMAAVSTSVVTGIELVLILLE